MRGKANISCRPELTLVPCPRTSLSLPLSLSDVTVGVVRAPRVRQVQRFLPQCELYEEGVTRHFIPLVAPIFGARQLPGLPGSLRGWDGCRAINTLGDRPGISLMLQPVVSLHSNSRGAESAARRPPYVPVQVSGGVVFLRAGGPHRRETSAP